MKSQRSSEWSVDALSEEVRRGDLRAVARAITVVERADASADALTDRLSQSTGRAYVVGVTGPAGAGKSTLVSRLVTAFRTEGRRVGVLAIDPTSPFSGGAVLGDRVRMQEHAVDRDVFIRSMATRGHLGGLARATMDAADVIDAAGFDVILIETVGVGQDEVDVARVADVSVVVLTPDLGDEVQALKAGVMEIADVFVLNKADGDGADRAVALIDQMLDLAESPLPARPPIVRTVATTGEGVEELVTVLRRQQAERSRRLTRRSERAERRVVTLLERRAVSMSRERIGGDEAWARLMASVAAGELSAREVAGQLIGAGGDGMLDHVGIACARIDDSLALFGDRFGLSVGPAEDVPSQGVRVRFVESGFVRLELVESLDPTSTFSQGLARRGPGLHHIALRVQNLDAALERLAAAGLRLIDTKGRPGAHGTTVAFLHPSSTQGVLIELVERRRD